MTMGMNLIGLEPGRVRGRAEASFGGIRTQIKTPLLARLF